MIRGPTPKSGSTAAGPNEEEPSDGCRRIGLEKKLLAHETMNPWQSWPGLRLAHDGWGAVIAQETAGRSSVIDRGMKSFRAQGGPSKMAGTTCSPTNLITCPSWSGQLGIWA